MQFLAPLPYGSVDWRNIAITLFDSNQRLSRLSHHLQFPRRKSP
jgi:hypothetical protein